MNDSMAQPSAMLSSLDLPDWKSRAGWLAASLMAVVFLVAGLWKITDAPGAAVRLAQMKVPEHLSLLATLGFGIAETIAGVFILVPRFRRWGAWVMSLLLVAFIAFIAYHYDALRGQECSCFPWVKRAVGPAFFVVDGLMLLLAVMAGIWSRPPHSMRSAAIVASAVTVFALVSYGVAAARQTGTKAPDTITADGKPFPLQQGKIFIYFFDPECMHCLDAGKRMAKLNWGTTKLVGVATQQPQFAPSFMQTTGLQGVVSPDLDLLKKTFPFVSPPAGAAIENGRQKAALTMFDGDEPGATLRKLGFVQ